MEAKHIQDIMEAYSSIYSQPEQEVVEDAQKMVGQALDAAARNPVIKAIGKVIAPVGGKGRKTPTATSGGYRPVKEEIGQLDEITASMGRRAKKYREDKAQAAHMERVRQHQHNMENDPEYAKKHRELSQVHSRRDNGGGGEDQKESVDLFDTILEYLVAEGYADTNKAALAIMANMSEEWKQSIVEGGINFSVPSRIDDFNNRRDELKNRYKQDVGPRIPGPGGGGQYGEPSAPKATGVRLARGTSSSNRGTETKNNA